METLKYRDYRAFLKAELEQRMEKNSAYSLRAFARDLSISPQMLSLVLNGKKTISPEIAGTIITRLGLDPLNASHFLDLTLLANTNSDPVRKIIDLRVRERAAASDTNFKTLDLEAFKAISDWHHFAILALTEVKGFRSDPKWIAERLGTSVFEATQALERLETLELLEKDAKTGRLKRTSLNMTATYGSPNAALRKLAKQLLEKGADALESQSINERDITNITMAIDPERLPKAKQMVTDFRRKLCDFLNAGEKTEVYTFAPALFRLTQKKETRK